MIHLQAITPQALAKAVHGLPVEEARKIVGAVHRRDCLPRTIPGVRRSSLEKVRAAASLPSLRILTRQESRLDPFVKYSLETPSGEVVEAVRIPLLKAGRFSVCVSSQAGCGLGCLFCATGHLGLSRNLDTWEIVEQVRVVRRSLDRSAGQRVHGLVFQGMGEPLANLDNVIDAIRVVCEPSGLAVDGRCVTVCTAGLPPGIRRLAQEVPKARLGLSITSTRHDLRSRLMPIGRIYPLEEVLDAAVEHARWTRLAPMWALTLLEGLNDTEDDAQDLVTLARSFAARSGLHPRITIVPFNEIAGGESHALRRTGDEREMAFRRVLFRAGIPCHKRYSGGSDVDAACGQLGIASSKQTEGPGPRA